MRLAHPTRLAVDGRTAAGKTTFADGLALDLRKGGREIIRTSIDGFHRSRAERYARGRLSAEGYYRDARDLAAIRPLLLDPLGPGGDIKYCTASLDLEADRAIEATPVAAARDAILVVDGTFLRRSELRDGWDVVAFLDTSEAVAEQRGVTRDASGNNDVTLVRKLYVQRYRPAYAIYERECQPSRRADAIVNNDDLDRPYLTIQPEGRFAI